MTSAQGDMILADLNGDNLQPNCPFPQDFLDFLTSLPQKLREPAGDVEPPHKRARVEAAEPVLISKETLTISRPGRPGQLIPCGTYADIGRVIRLTYNPKQQHLCIASKSTAKHAKFTSLISLASQRIDDRLAVFLDVANLSRDDPKSEGSVWSTVGLELSRKADLDRMIFTCSLYWNTAINSLRNGSQRSLSQVVLDTFLKSARLAHVNGSRGLAPQAFYEAAHLPESNQPELSALVIPGLETELYPFQRRALQWLLRREGVKWTKDPPGIEPHSEESSSQLPLSFVTARDANSAPLYVSDLYHVLSRDLSCLRTREIEMRGGILAEEMGLGKTVEVISLILLHRRQKLCASEWDPHAGQELRPTRATLIVTPMTLLKQWLSEFERHAPGLRVMVYGGMKTFKGDESELVADFADHDVVVTTYNVLQAEIHFAEKPPERAMRHERQYRRPKSPLVQLRWWRVCLDEAQQIESGVSNAAKVARMIPRINAWGVTGTPVKEDIKDLWGLLLFLRYEPFASSHMIWSAMITTHQDLFKTLFNRIALRHTKKAVRSELELPPQNRYVITMPFTAIEEQHYQSQFKQLARNFGLDSRGAPLSDDWDPEDPEIQDLMKRALAQLRQTVLHPELGPGRLRSLAQKNRPLRTIDEVLDTMIEQAESSIQADQRTFLSSILKRGQYLENSPRVREALEIWSGAQDNIRVIVDECRQQLRVELEKAKRAGVDDVDGDPEDSEDDDEADEMNPEKAAIRKRVGDSRRKLRSALDLEHRVVFFIASAYYQIKSNEEMTKPDTEDFKRLEKLEIESYESAKRIRKEILQEAFKRAETYMSNIQEDAASQSFVEIPELETSSFQGLESRRIIENLETMVGVLNEQANLIDDWREHVVQILLRALVDEEAEADITGEEYEDSTKIQDALMVYTLALRAAISDRQDAISGLQNERTRYETSFAERQAKEGEGPAPEKLLELLSERDAVRLAPHQGSYRGIISELRELATKFRHDATGGSHRAQVELDIVQRHLKRIQDQVNEQTKATTALEKELERFTGAMNARVEYYRQLQAISDTVAPVDRGDVDDVDATLNVLKESEERLGQIIVAAKSKHRYLLHLKEMGDTSAEQKPCIICQSTFTLGVLTVCGHQFCKDCIMMWFKAHHNCPVCKKKLTLPMLHDITLRKQDLKVHQEQSTSSRNPDVPHRSRKSGIYTEFSESKLSAIKNIPLIGPSYATKIDTMIKHMMWLREADPGAKCVIFSQFREFLAVLSRAFERYRIGFTSFENKKNGITKFKEDPAVECFLMDARAHASGLNLVNASHVFLCEPLLNTALELQAIARVDRIGQKHETTVWLYLVEGTVEESIYNLSAKRRLEHMGRESNGESAELNSLPDVSDLNIEAANSMELQQTDLAKLMNKEKQLGEVVDQSDLWDCLFGHVAQQQGPAAESDERFNDPAVMGFLAGEAADRRRDE